MPGADSLGAAIQLLEALHRERTYTSVPALLERLYQDTRILAALTGTRRGEAQVANLEKVVETVDEQQLQKWAPEIARIGTHNAYHIGQMVFVRKLQGSWDPAKGIK